MRIRIQFDSATTAQVRALSVALVSAHLPDGNRLTLGVEGPECWGGVTPNLTPGQFARVFAALVKANGRPIAEVLNEWVALNEDAVTS